MKKPLRKCKSGWRRELGTSKKEQGIVTPKAPRHRKGQRVITKKKSVIDSWLDIFKEKGDRHVARQVH